MAPLSATTTTQCMRHGHREFTIQYQDPPVLPSWVMWFVQFLESDVAAGASYEPDQTVQIGWMICKLVSAVDGTLGILEPDFKTMPVNWAESVTETLAHLFIQKYVAESVGLDQLMEFPTPFNTAIVCSNFLSAPGFFISRTEPSSNNDNDSGWFFGCTNPQHDHNSAEVLGLASLYECAVRKPALFQYLALPLSTTVLNTGSPDEFELTFNGQLIQPGKGTYLERSLQQ